MIILRTKMTKTNQKLKFLKINSSDKIAVAKNNALDNAVEQIKKKDVITVDSMSFAKIIKENEAKTKSYKAVDNKDIGDKNVTPEKQKPKKKKLTKDEIQQSIITEFEDDCKKIYKDRTNSCLDMTSKKCKKCDYETFSEGTLRVHKVDIHKLKETKENIVLGYQNDVREHLEILKAMEDNLFSIKCDQCNFKTHSKGLLRIHMYSMH